MVALSFVPSFAMADEGIRSWASRRVEESLLRPLAQQEKGRFSRARIGPTERRVRVEGDALTKARNGGSFVAFAIDSRYGQEWSSGDIEGCVYGGTGAIFVRVGEEYRPAAFLLGKNVEAVAGACQAAP